MLLLALPCKRVPLRSQLASLMLEQTLSGIAPVRFGLEVRERVVRLAGRDVGGVVNGLFVRNLGQAWSER